MEIFIYKLNNNKTAEIKKSTELQAQINSLGTTINDLQNKIDMVSETVNLNISTQNISTSSSSSINTVAIKSSIQKYLDILQIFISNTLNILVELDLKTTPQTSNNYKGFYSDKQCDNSYFLITDVSFYVFILIAVQ